MRKPLDVEEAIRKGGVWAYDVDAKVRIDSDGHDLIQATVVKQLPKRHYLIKTIAGHVIDVPESDILERIDNIF